MRVMKAGLMAMVLLLASAAVANAADICFELTTTGTVANSILNGTTLMVGRGFGALPSAGACKDFRGFANADQAIWFTGQACGASNNLDVSFFLAASDPFWERYGHFFFPLERDTLATQRGIVCTADIGMGGVCRGVTVAKVACPRPVTVPQGTDPTCPGVC
jgi:hypothetical protein